MNQVCSYQASSTPSFCLCAQHWEHEGTDGLSLRLQGEIFALGDLPNSSMAALQSLSLLVIS